MRTRGFVEVTQSLEPSLLGRLVVAAYSASRMETVVLAGRGVPLNTLDRHLDRAVAEHGLDVCGVLFLPADSTEEALLTGATNASFVIVASVDLSSALIERNVAHMNVLEGISYLERLGRQKGRLEGVRSGVEPPAPKVLGNKTDPSRRGSVTGMVRSCDRLDGFDHRCLSSAVVGFRFGRSTLPADAKSRCGL